MFNDCPSHVSNYTYDYCIGDVVVNSPETVIVIWLIFIGVSFFMLWRDECF